MRGLYRPLETSLLGPDTTYQHPEQHLPMNLTPDSPAIDVMTDLRRVAAQAVSTFCGIDQATERMKNAGVRLLFVINQSYEIQGILTSQDILEEKVVKYMNAHNTRREDVTARDLMTPQGQVEVLQMYDVARATVGDIIRTFKQMGRQHALVVEEMVDARPLRQVVDPGGGGCNRRLRLRRLRRQGSKGVHRMQSGCCCRGGGFQTTQPIPHEKGEHGGHKGKRWQSGFCRALLRHVRQSRQQ